MRRQAEANRRPQRQPTFDPGRIAVEEIDLPPLSPSWARQPATQGRRGPRGGRVYDAPMPLDPIPSYFDEFGIRMTAGRRRGEVPRAGRVAPEDAPVPLSFVPEWVEGGVARGRAPARAAQTQPPPLLVPGLLPDASEIVPAAWLSAATRQARMVRGGRVSKGVAPLAFVLDVTAWPVGGLVAGPTRHAPPARVAAVQLHPVPVTEEEGWAPWAAGLTVGKAGPRKPGVSGGLSWHDDLDVATFLPAALSPNLSSFVMGWRGADPMPGATGGDVPRDDAPLGWAAGSTVPPRVTPPPGRTYFVAPRWHGISATGGPYFVVAGDTFAAGAVAGQVQGQ